MRTRYMYCSLQSVPCRVWCRQSHSLVHAQQLCDAIASWGSPPSELNTEFHNILTGYKSSIPPEQWATFMATRPADLRNRLVERYAL